MPEQRLAQWILLNSDKGAYIRGREEGRHFKVEDIPERTVRIRGEISGDVGSRRRGLWDPWSDRTAHTANTSGDDRSAKAASGRRARCESFIGSSREREQEEVDY